MAALCRRFLYSSLMSEASLVRSRVVAFANRSSRPVFVFTLLGKNVGFAKFGGEKLLEANEDVPLPTLFWTVRFPKL